MSQETLEEKVIKEEELLRIFKKILSMNIEKIKEMHGKNNITLGELKELITKVRII